MVTIADRVMDEVLSLPADQRMNLADRILESLNSPTDPEIDAQWAVEVERRVQEISNGEVELIPGEEVFAKIHLKYKK
ncbi:MAG: addiction module protein [Kiritimatiellae bacterium]|jgi:putative addiction module component (TIGR02574 family)|nr:addiction module protein [Kiritimatiellia bacterium]